MLKDTGPSASPELPLLPQAANVKIMTAISIRDKIFDKFFFIISSINIPIVFIVKFST